MKGMKCLNNFVITGFSDEIAPDLKTQMDELEKIGISHIEMRGVNGKSIVQHSIDEVKKIKKQLDERGFKVSAVGSPIGKTNINDDFEPELQLLKHTKEIAEVLDTQYIRVFSFFIQKGEKVEDYRSEVMRRYGEFIKVLEGSNIILLHENERETYGDIPNRCMDLFKTINSSHLKGIIDIGNFVLSGVEDVLEAYEYLKNDIVYVHIKDASVDEKHFLPIGEGNGRAKEILSILNKNSQNYFLSIEPHLGYLPCSGAEQFNVAYQALKTLIDEVTENNK